MLPSLATIVAIYAVARLVQVPIEFSPASDPDATTKRILLVGVTVAAVAAICFFLAHIYDTSAKVAGNPFAP